MCNRQNGDPSISKLLQLDVNIVQVYDIQFVLISLLVNINFAAKTMYFIYLAFSKL